VFVALLLHSLDLAGDVKFVILTVVGVAGSFACGWAVLVLGRALTSRGR
jgi:hypothetical protein